MKYLTKEWYELCQCTGLHFGLKVHKGAGVYDQDLYLRLYKRKENEFVKMEHEVYDVDPRFMLEHDGCKLVLLDKVLNGEELNEEDKIVYNMPPEQRERIKKRIEKYDSRPPFDEKKCREEFRSNQETLIVDVAVKLPYELIQQIADIRVFSLGYCTRGVLKQLKKLSNDNEKKMKSIINEYENVRQEEDIPQNIKDGFGFHDCKVTQITTGKNTVMRFDTQGGFTDFNKLTFIGAEIIRQEENIVGSFWIYQELYREVNGYEAHMLFAGDGMPELIIYCNDIIIEKE